MARNPRVRVVSADWLRGTVAAVAGGLGGLSGLDLLFEIDVGDAIVEIDAEPPRFFFLCPCCGTRYTALRLGRGARNVDHLPALGADPLLSRVFVANFERSLARRAEDIDRHGIGTFFRTLSGRSREPAYLS
jgi:hypothetical protein